MKKIIIFLIIFNTIIFANTPKEKQAIDFVLKDINNRNVKLSETVKKYKLTIINFWATWCVPCRAELKDLNKLFQNYEDKNLHIISISVDDPKTVSRVKSFIRANNIKHEIWLDTNNNVIRKYHVSNPPFTIIVDENMNIIYEHKGYRKGDILFMEKMINNLMKKEK